jgi:hypothetical protein
MVVEWDTWHLRVKFRKAGVIAGGKIVRRGFCSFCWRRVYIIGRFTLDLTVVLLNHELPATSYGGGINSIAKWKPNTWWVWVQTKIYDLTNNRYFHSYFIFYRIVQNWTNEDGDSFGGLVLASGIRVRGFKPGRSHWIFFGHLKNPSHAFLRRESERICPMSQLCGM